MTENFEWAKRYPKCKGCKYLGRDIPCNYFFDTGKTPQSQGVKLDWRGDGGCELREDGTRKRRADNNIVFSQRSIMNRHAYNKTDSAETRNLYEQGLSDGEIADRIGVKPYTVARWRQRYSLPSNSYFRKGKINDAKAMQLYEEGKSDIEIAEKLGVISLSVHNWRHRNNLPAHQKNKGRRYAKGAVGNG